MRKSFSLVELLVVAMIVVLISGSALIYLNNFNSQQKLNQNRDEVVAAVKLAQSYAKTRQLPPGSVQQKLRFVEVKVVGGNRIEADANGIGDTYFSNPIVGENVTIEMEPIYFWGGNGYVVDGATGNLVGSDDKAIVMVESRAGSQQIVVDALGQVSFVVNSTDWYPTIVAATATPTIRPSNTPTSTPNTPTPTGLIVKPTFSTCKASGASCSKHSDCCSNYCSYGFCGDLF